MLFRSPEPDDAEKTQRKLKSGLPLLAQPKAVRQNRQAQRPEFQKKRTEAPPATPPPAIQ